MYRKLNCFIASAFGYDDVDRIYKKTIKTVLQNMKIEPLRVDQIEHNDDIDDKIIELIKKCDFCIADLTYARPSVYYEAGYVHGLKKPVIFLAKSDHFESKGKVLEDNLRIHFDLQMKNIIKWKNPTTTLANRLLSRVEIVTKPIIKSLQQEEIYKKDLADFALLPQTEQLGNLIIGIKLALLKRNFIIAEKTGKNNIIAVKKYEHSWIFVWGIAQESFTKADLKDIIIDLNGNKFRTLYEFLKKMKIDAKKMTSHILCCSLRTTPKIRISNAIPYYRPQEKLKIYSYGHSEYTGPRNFHFIDGIKSLPEFNNIFIDHLKLIGKIK